MNLVDFEGGERGVKIKDLEKVHWFMYGQRGIKIDKGFLITSAI